jgi:hypothetical protein
VQSTTSITHSNTILITNVSTYLKLRKHYDSLVAGGKKLVFLNLPEGDYLIGEDSIKVVKPTMGSYYFVSNATGHSLAKQLHEADLSSGTMVKQK